MTQPISSSKSPKIMGIINVTPDSFSDGGDYANHDRAIDHGISLLRQGADILDIGGESTRPGADIIYADQECDRVIPVIEGLVKWIDDHDIDADISIDTRNAGTMHAALAAGAGIINDVSALSHDPLSIDVAREFPLSQICLMHMRGTPQNMASLTQYEDVVAEVKAHLKARIDFCLQHGIDQNRLIIDPGIGFAKDSAQNCHLLHHISAFQDLGCPILLGASRKRFISDISLANQGEELPAKDRLAGSIAANLWGASQGAAILRVHDVAATRQALNVWQAINQ